MSGDSPVQIVADALFVLRPATYGNRWDGDEDSPLGRDALAIVEALHVEDRLCSPRAAVRLGLTETALWLAEYRAAELSAMLRGMARRARTRAGLIHLLTDTLEDRPTVDGKRAMVRVRQGAGLTR